MKFKEYKKLLAIAIMSATVASMVGVSVYATPAATTATVAEVGDNSTSSSDSTKKQIPIDSATSSTKAVPTKDETVYAKIDGSGSVQKVTVSDQLQNVNGVSSIDDISTLQDITNVKGDEEFSQNGNQLKWDGDGKDIVYQGTTSKELPVGINISYTLDGKEVSADELEGKSGHLVMRYSYTNNTLAQNGSYTPFVMVTGVILDTDIFKDVTISKSGKISSDGNRNLAIGMCIPGLKDDLDIENANLTVDDKNLSDEVADLGLEDYFEVEADVTDYEAPTAATVATNELFNQIESNGFDSIDEVKESMQTLQDSANQLVDGSGQLKGGLDTLLSSSGELVNGVDQLANGGNTLANGTSQLSDATNTLASSTQQMSAGASEISAKVTNELQPGAAQLDAGIDQINQKLSESIDALGTNVNALYNGTVQLAAGASALQGTLPLAANGISAMEDGVNQIQGAADQLGGAANALGTVSSGLENGADSAKKMSNLLASGYNDTISITGDATIASGDGSVTGTVDTTYPVSLTQTATVDTSSYTADAQAQVRAAMEASGCTEDQIAAVVGAISLPATASGEQTFSDGAYPVNIPGYSLSGTGTMTGSATVTGTENIQNTLVAQGLNQLSGNLTTAKDGVDQVKTGVATAATGISNGTPQLLGGLDQLNTQLTDTSSATSGNPTTIAAGIAAMNAGFQGMPGSTGLLPGMSALNNAINNEDTGFTSQVKSTMGTLKAGTSQLNTGTAQLQAGLSTLSSGASQISSGSSTLSQKMAEASTGAQTLSSGLNALQGKTPTLVSGISQLDEGATTLSDGMSQFNEEGIEKLVSLFDGDVDGLLTKVNEMLDSSKSYKSFSGISDNMDGNVKFIFINQD